MKTVEELSLADLEQGQIGFIKELNCSDLLRHKLLGYGFVPGTKVRSGRMSPLEDPRIYCIWETEIALRQADAKGIKISLNAEKHDRISCPNLNLRTGQQTNNNSMFSELPGISIERSVPPKHDGKLAGEQEKSRTHLVALAGNPNTGKSTVFNTLTGLQQHVGNWPGKTVSRSEGSYKFAGDNFNLVDLPGTYSLCSTSIDEDIARDFILFEKPDCLVVVLDATALERNLNLVLQVLEMTNRVVICLNLMDEAERKGIEIAVFELERFLGVPIVPTVATTGEGFTLLKKRIFQLTTGILTTSPIKIPFQPQLQRAMDELVLMVEDAIPGIQHPRWVALRLLDGSDNKMREQLLAGTLTGSALSPDKAPLGGRLQYP
ncbi:FeoB small GTPase domain-containing protein [Candidatus Riflebacteria bacterium]